VIADNQSLVEFAGQIAPYTRIGVDTEADSLHSYREKLCLIQVSIPGRDEIVDPLSGIDLQPLLDALASTEIVLQGADFDVRMLCRAGTFKPGKIFDTTLAARLTGRREFGLAALVREFFGLDLPKSSQKADWGKRPLTEQMIRYARNDTHYLIEIADRLEAELRALGRKEWFDEWCERVRDSALETRERDPDSQWRIRGSHTLGARGEAVLRTLWHWREEEAAKIDRPTFHILRNDQLLDAAKSLVTKGTADPAHLKGGRRKRFEEACQAALAIPEQEWPTREFRPRVRPPKEFFDKVESYKAHRDKIAAELHLDPSVLAPRAALEAVARDPSQAPAVFMKWQLNLLRLEGTASAQLPVDPGVEVR
jgi:ribonuclease D